MVKRATMTRLFTAICLLSCAASAFSPNSAVGIGPTQIDTAPVLGDAPTAAEGDRALAELGLRATERAAQAPVETDTSDAAQALDIQNRESVIGFYMQRDATPVTWTGSVSACAAGDTPDALKQSMLRRINYFRAMAGVPASITLSPTFNAAAQKAALMMSANGRLSHSPDTSWRCYSVDGARAAGSSNIGLGLSGPAIVDLYMKDYGANNAPVGHRRWLLYPQARQMGAGDVPASPEGRAANAIWILDGTFGTARPTTRDGFVAWPPAGFVPHQVVYPRWSFSYPGADFSSATVRMSANGSAWPVRLEAITPNFGEPTLVWIPNDMTDGANWPTPTSDQAIDVTIANVKIGTTVRDFTYRVTVINPVSDNNPPQAVAAPEAIRESAVPNTVSTTLVVSDPDIDDAHTFTLISGAGDAYNHAFKVVGNTLVNTADLDYESTPLATVRLRATDRAGASIVQIVQLSIADVNEAPRPEASSFLVRNGAFSVSTAIVDPEGRAVTVTPISPTNGITVTFTAGRLIISGDIRALGGNATVTFNVSDADGVSEVRTIVLQAARSTILLPIAVR
jgi:uncharacterized protein YkwD